MLKPRWAFQFMYCSSFYHCFSSVRREKRLVHCLSPSWSHCPNTILIEVLWKEVWFGETLVLHLRISPYFTGLDLNLLIHMLYHIVELNPVFDRLREVITSKFWWVFPCSRWREECSVQGVECPRFNCAPGTERPLYWKVFLHLKPWIYAGCSTNWV